MPNLPRQGTCVARMFRANATPAERALWSLLRGRALGAKFRRQHPIGPFIVDFYCCATALALEVDGSVHDEPRNHQRDRYRDEFLASIGVRVVRLRNELVLHEPERAIALIKAALFAEEVRERGASANPSLREGLGEGK